MKLDEEYYAMERKAFFTKNIINKMINENNKNMF